MRNELSCFSEPSLNFFSPTNKLPKVCVRNHAFRISVPFHIFQCIRSCHVRAPLPCVSNPISSRERPSSLPCLVLRWSPCLAPSHVTDSLSASFQLLLLAIDPLTRSAHLNEHQLQQNLTRSVSILHRVRQTSIKPLRLGEHSPRPHTADVDEATVRGTA